MARKLTPDERELWQRVASTAQPRHPDHPRRVETHDKPKKAKPTVKEFRIGQSIPEAAFRQDLAPSLADRIAHAPVRMDRRAHQQMVRGKLKPEARIDLHGMTLAQAHPELIRFVTSAHSAGKRLVLVITGKGKRGADDGPIPQRQGVLRHQVPQWLTQPPLGGLVLQVNEAHLRHGGSGAYYVYLRRMR